MAESVVTAYLTKTLGQGERFADAAKTFEGRSIATITEEILQLKTKAGDAIIAIGERLIEAKALLDHGDWLPWLNEQVEFSERTAQEFMRISREWSNPRTLADLGKSKVLKLLTLPPAEREEFLSEHNVVDMTARQLDDAIRRQKELERETEKLSEQLEIERQNAETMNNTNEDLRRRISATETANKALLADRDRDEARIVSLINEVKELKDRPVEVAVQVDEEAVTKAAEEARAAAEAEWRGKLSAAEAKAKKAEEKAKAAAGKVDAGELDAAKQAEQEARAEAERLRAALESEQKKLKDALISADADLILVQELGGHIYDATNKLHGILIKVRGRNDEKLSETVKLTMIKLADRLRGCAE